MKIKHLILCICIIVISHKIFSQGKGTYSISNSQEFESPDDMELDGTTTYSNGNILFTYYDSPRFEKIGLQVFSPELKQVKMVYPDLKAMFPDKKSYFGRTILMNKKAYLLVRQVFKETKTEGMSAVEFS